MIKAIIADADGTLVNTLHLIRHGQYETATQYLVERGVPKGDIPEYFKYESFINKSVGGPTRETFEKTIKMMFSETHEHHLEKIDFDELDKKLAPIQDYLAPLYVHPFHGLTELFTWMGRDGMGLGIFTSGNRRMIIRNFGVSLPVLGYTELFEMDEISVDERFEAFIARTRAVFGIDKIEVVTCDDEVKAKPDPEGILNLLERLGVGKEEVVVIGDHAVDILAAKAAGINSIGISHGFGTPAELMQAGAVKVVDDLSALPQLIEAHNSGNQLLFG